MKMEAKHVINRKLNFYVEKGVLKCKNEGNIPTGRPQKVDGKNGVFCLIIMIIPRIIVTKMSKMAHSLYFLLTATKDQSQFGQRFYLAPSANSMGYWILSYY